MSTLQRAFLSLSGSVAVKYSYCTVYNIVYCIMNESTKVWQFLSCGFSASFSSACEAMGTWWSLGQTVPFFS